MALQNNSQSFGLPLFLRSADEASPLITNFSPPPSYAAAVSTQGRPTASPATVGQGNSTATNHNVAGLHAQIVREQARIPIAAFLPPGPNLQPLPLLELSDSEDEDDLSEIEPVGPIKIHIDTSIKVEGDSHTVVIPGQSVRTANVSGTPWARGPLEQRDIPMPETAMPSQFPNALTGVPESNLASTSEALSAAPRLKTFSLQNQRTDTAERISAAVISGLRTSGAITSTGPNSSRPIEISIKASVHIAGTGNTVRMEAMIPHSTPVPTKPGTRTRTWPAADLKRRGRQPAGGTSIAETIPDLLTGRKRRANSVSLDSEHVYDAMPYTMADDSNIWTLP